MSTNPIKEVNRQLYLLEYIGGAEKEVFVLRNPQSGDVITLASTPDELCEFLREIQIILAYGNE